MKFRKENIGIELTREGIYACSHEGRFRITSFEELKKVSAGKSLGVAIGRDVLFVRKYSFPVEALEDIKEAVILNIEEIFPLKEPLTVSVLPLEASEKEVECLIFAIPQSLYDQLLSLPKLRFLVPSPALYRYLGDGLFYRNLREGLYEKVLIKDGKLTDTVLSEKADGKVIEDEYSVACLALEVLLKGEPLEPVFYDRRRFFPIKIGKRYIYTAVGVFIFLLLGLGAMAYDLYYLKGKLNRVNEEIEKIQPLADRYETKLREVNAKRTILQLLKDGDFLETFADLVDVLPAKTKIVNLYYDGKSMTIEGYTPSLSLLTQSLQGKYRDVQVQASQLKPPYGQPFKIRVAL